MHIDKYMIYNEHCEMLHVSSYSSKQFSPSWDCRRKQHGPLEERKRN